MADRLDAAGTTGEVGLSDERRIWLPAIIVPEARTDRDEAGAGPGPAKASVGTTSTFGLPRRLTARAAVIAIAVALGGLLGAVATMGIGQVLAARDSDTATEEAVAALRSSIGQLAAEIKSLRDSVGQSGRSAASVLAALDQRIASAERGQAEVAQRVLALSESLSRQPAPGLAAVSPEATGAIARGGKPPVARDWVLWRVRNGRALVQGNGGYFEVVPGSSLPGLGLVQRIAKQNGRWMVLTQYGVIVSRG